MVSNGLVSNGLINIPRSAAMADASTEFVYGHWMVSNGLSLPLLGLVPCIECVCGHWMVLNGLVGTAVTTGAVLAFAATGWSRRGRNDRRKHQMRSRPLDGLK